MRRSRLLALLVPATLTTSCTNYDLVRADSLQAVATEQMTLMTQLSAQKDSLTSIVLDADKFISQVDSQISTVKGLPTKKRAQRPESPIEEQLLARQEMLARVGALVDRAKTTAAQLAESRKREQALRGEKAKLQEKIGQDEKLIADLGETIQRQTATIAGLQLRVDSLSAESRRLGEEMRTLGSRHYRAYYIVGTERELLEKGIVQHEGGANLLIARVGRSLLPARALKPELFTQIDQRDVQEIPLPDTTRQYRIVSRQSLDNAQVAERDGPTFRGKLSIDKPGAFWAPSRYLIIVQR